MQNLTPYKIYELNFVNIYKIKNIYNSFRTIAIKDFGYMYEPLPFEDFKSAVENQIIKGFILSEDDNYDGFLLYVEEEHKVIEVNIIYVDNTENINKKRFELIKTLVNKYKKSDNWDVISYGLLGQQSSFAREIALLGFQLIGQAVVKFDFYSPIANKIFEINQYPPLPEGYFIKPWKDEYLEQASIVINESFKDTEDAKYDPRFLSVEGSKSVIKNIVFSLYGPFLPDATSVLIQNEKVIGVCFLNISSVDLINLPLIGIKKSHRNKGFGKYLLKNSLHNVREKIKKGELPCKFVNAGVETDNYPAIKMYRRLGFTEDYCYIQSFLNKKRIELIDKIYNSQ